MDLTLPLQFHFFSESLSEPSLSPFFPLIFIFCTSLVQLPWKMVHILGLSECFLRIISGFKMQSKDPLEVPWTTSPFRPGTQNFSAILYFRGGRRRTCTHAALPTALPTSSRAPGGKAARGRMIIQ